MNTVALKSKSDTINWLMAFFVFTFSALLPEYLAPVFLAVATIFTIRKKHALKKSFGSFYIGYIVLAYMCWMLIGMFYSKSIVSGFGNTFLWVMMVGGIWVFSQWIDTPNKMEQVIFGGALAAGANGLIGILQAGIRAVFPNIAHVTNSFWRFIDLIVEAIFKIVVLIIPYEFPKTSFSEYPDRSCGTFSNPLFYATFLVTMIPFAMYCFLNCKERKHRIIGLVCLLLSLGGIAFSYSRGPYIFAVMVLLLLLIYGGKRALKIFGITAAGGVAMLVAFGGDVVSRLLTLLNTDDKSVNLRKSIYTAILEKIPDRFVFGYGTGFESVRNILHNEYNIKQPHAHNILLQIQMENGIIGIILFLAICLTVVYSLFRIYRKGGQARDFAITLFVSFAGMMMCGMTDCIFYGLKPLQYMMMIFGLTQACVMMYLKGEKFFRWKIEN